MSPNVKAAMCEWVPDPDLPVWALEKAAEITEQTVPQVNPHDGRNMLYQMPAGLKVRLTLEIARALVETENG